MDSHFQKILLPFRILSVYQPPNGCRPCGILVILVAILVAASYYSDDWLDKLTTVRFLLDIFQGIAPVISYLVIVLEVYKSRKANARIFKLVQDILDIFDGHLKTPLVLEVQKSLNWFLFYAISLQITFFAIELSILIGIQRNSLWFYNRLVSFVGCFGSRLFLLYFLMHVRNFGFLLRNILDYQKRINFQMQFNKPEKDQLKIERQQKRQLHLRRAYNKLVLINWLVNDSFKYSLTFTFVTNVGCIAISWIWNYLSLRFGNKFGLGEAQLSFQGRTH